MGKTQIQTQEIPSVNIFMVSFQIWLLLQHKQFSIIIILAKTLNPSDNLLKPFKTYFNPKDLTIHTHPSEGL